VGRVREVIPLPKPDRDQEQGESKRSIDFAAIMNDVARELLGRRIASFPPEKKCDTAPRFQCRLISSKVDGSITKPTKAAACSIS